MRELYVITKAKDMGNYIYTITDKSPKKFRFTLVPKLQSLTIDIIENLYRANFVYVRNGKDEQKIIKRQGYQKVSVILFFILQG